MAQSTFHRLLGGIGFYAVALFTYALLFFLSIKSGSFFRKESEKDKNDLALGMLGLNAQDMTDTCSPAPILEPQRISLPRLRPPLPPPP